MIITIVTESVFLWVLFETFLGAYFEYPLWLYWIPTAIELYK